MFLFQLLAYARSGHGPKNMNMTFYLTLQPLCLYKREIGGGGLSWKVGGGGLSGGLGGHVFHVMYFELLI